MNILKKIMSVLLVFVILFANFRSILEINLLFIYVPLSLYLIYIFYPRKVEIANTSRLKNALGLIFIGIGVFWTVYIFTAGSSMVTNTPVGNLSILIFIYALFWLVLGCILVKKSHIKLSQIIS